MGSQEEPLVAALDFDTHKSATYCGHCFRNMKGAVPAAIEADVLRTVFCSQQCNVRAKLQTDNFLFGEGRALPLGLDDEPSDEAKVDRKEAQEAFIDLWRNSNKTSLMIAARLAALQINAEIIKAVPSAEAFQQEFPKLCFINDYSISDHMERLRYLDLDVPKAELRSSQHLLAMTTPALAASHTDERYLVLRGKVTYNAIGVNFDENTERDVRSPSWFKAKRMLISTAAS